MLKDVDRGPCIDKQYSRQLWGGWVGLPLYAISIQKEILTIMDGPLLYFYNIHVLLHFDKRFYFVKGDGCSKTEKSINDGIVNKMFKINVLVSY